MGIFSKKKDQPLRQPLDPVSETQQPSSHTQRSIGASGSRASQTTNAASVPDLALDWSKIYVEIDNDANGAVCSREQQRSSDDDYGAHHTVTHSSYDDTAGQTLTGFGSSSGSTGTEMTLNFSNLRSTGNNPSSHEVEEHEDDDDAEEQDGTRTQGTSSLPNTTMDMDETTRATSAGGTRTFVPAPSYLPSIRTNLTSKDDMTVDNCTITNNGKYLTTNDFANAQLMRWKFAAEEGPAYIQILALSASLAGLSTTLYPLVTSDAYWTVPNGICAFHTTILCSIILIFEFRAMGARNPMNVRARARTMMTRYLNILRLLWGRGCLYIFTGSMNITIWFIPYSVYTGLTLVAVGILAILVGSHASFNLERLKLSLTDHSFLWSKFEEADSNKDNLIDISEFSNLIWSLGLELDDAYTFRAFSQIDNDSDARINFREFKRWWIAVQDDDKVAATSATLPRAIEV